MEQLRNFCSCYHCYKQSTVRRTKVKPFTQCSIELAQLLQNWLLCDCLVYMYMGGFEVQTSRGMRLLSLLWYKEVQHSWWSLWCHPDSSTQSALHRLAKCCSVRSVFYLEHHHLWGYLRGKSPPCPPKPTYGCSVAYFHNIRGSGDFWLCILSKW